MPVKTVKVYHVMIIIHANVCAQGGDYYWQEGMFGKYP